MASTMIRGRPTPRSVFVVSLALALLASAGAPATARQAGEPQTAGRTQYGTVASDWSWEPTPVPGAPAAIRAPELLEKAVPGFPSPERAREGYQGHVIVEATIGVDGQVLEPRVVRTPAPEIFDDSVLAALRRWTFRPATRSGVPVAVTGIFTFTFHIEVSDEAAQGAEVAGLRADAVRMGADGLVAPRQLTTELPEYTDEAKERGVQGDVYIEAVVTREGNVVEPVLVRGLADEELNRRALEAITHWTFAPGTRDSEPVDVLALFTVTFRIHERP